MILFLLLVGTTGQFCGIVLDGCDSSPCGIHGSCTNLLGNFSCTCEPGYTGNCSEPLTLLHSEWPKLCGVLAILSAIGLT